MHFNVRTRARTKIDCTEGCACRSSKSKTGQFALHVHTHARARFPIMANQSVSFACTCVRTRKKHSFPAYLRLGESEIRDDRGTSTVSVLCGISDHAYSNEQKHCSSPAMLPRIHTFSWGREAEMVVKETMSEKNMVTFFLGCGGT